MRWSHGALASSMVNQFTKGQLFSDLWVEGQLELPLNQKEFARKLLSCFSGVFFENTDFLEFPEIFSLKKHPKNTLKVEKSHF